MSGWPDSVRVRLAAKVEVEKGADGHWRWTGRIDTHGYATMRVNGRWKQAHRLVVWLAQERWPGQMFNRCGLRSCVRLEHWVEAGIDGRPSGVVPSGADGGGSVSGGRL